MNEIEIQQVAGQFFDLEGDPEINSLKISLNLTAVIYKNETQIIGDQRLVEMDEEGNWATQLVDTDNMSDEAHYIFKINDRIYKKFVPVGVHCHNFNDLPDVIF